MGFCFLNAVAAAARHAQRHHGIQKVAILDWDVHHGNGTQEIFYSDPSVLFIDVHRDGVWPESGGHAEEKGNGPGVGTTINVPLPAGAGHTAAMAAFEKIVAPALRRFDPGLILVSAGYDAHWKDPLETLQFQSATYHALAAGVRAVAEEVCGGRVVFILEGGYDCASLGESVAETVRALVGLQARTEVLPPKAMPQEEPEALVEAALGAVAKMGCELSKRGVALL